MSVRIETNVGNFVLNLFTEDAPKASYNFLKLCKINYYAYSIFLRCEANFLLQGGDPSNTGRGGESIWQLLSNDKNKRFFADEIDVKKRKHEMRGTLSMAAAGKDKNATQFFLTLADDLDFLDGTCTIFGQLTSSNFGGSSESVDLDGFFDYFNNELFCDENGRPFQDVFIIKTVVLSDPFPDPEGLLKLTCEHCEPTESFLKAKRIGAHESLDDFKGKTEEEMEEELRERTAKSNALVLEIIGDLPSADVKPPENVLFVCKLNPITQADDLKMIFSRFGAIASCEIIKDRDTGASLGYAFIEFEEKEACEKAYMKMDGVLIDDRRVKVDFSQSVAKLHKQWEDKRNGNTKRNSGKTERANSEIGEISESVNRDSRDHKYHSDSRDRRDYRDSRDHRDYVDSRDSRDGHYSRDRRDYRDSRDYNRDNRDYRDTRDRSSGSRYRSRSPNRRY